MCVASRAGERRENHSTKIAKTSSHQHQHEDDGDLDSSLHTLGPMGGLAVATASLLALLATT
jgi:hypothetical protein